MRPFSWLAVIATASLLPACFVYDNSLIGGDSPSVGGTGGETTGTGAMGGETGESGGSGGGESGGSGGGETGGSGGDTTTPDRCEITGVSDFDMIADMRSPVNTILPTDGRGGAWTGYHGSDITPSPAGTDTQGGNWPSSPPPMTEVPGDAGDYALHYTTTLADPGSPSEQWHWFGFFLTGTSEDYDASAWDGIILCARSDSWNSFGVQMVDEAKTGDGSQGEWSGADGVSADTDWAVYKIPFPDEWPTDTLQQIQFHGTTSGIYDLWIDDIAFYKD